MGNMAMVQFLVEHGADVMIAEKDGERPYTIAVSNKHTAMADYLRSLELADFHHTSLSSSRSQRCTSSGFLRESCQMPNDHLFREAEGGFTFVLISS